MAEEAVEITNREDLQEWLRDKPRDWSRAIAARAALRVLPLVIGILDRRISLDDRQKKNLVLQAFRASFVSWAARKYPAEYRIGGDAARAARAAAYYAARAAGYTAAWRAVRADCEWLQARATTGLIDQPLWPADRPGEVEPGTDTPEWIREPLDGFDQQDWLHEKHWNLWLNWYRAILPADPHARPASAFGETADIEIALGDRPFWQGDDPDAVMAAISALVNRAQGTVQVRLSADGANYHDDSLGRAILAFLLARPLNRIWDDTNEQDDGTARSPTDDPAGFVVHVDAPWGGGKTSFANYLTQILNPYRLRDPLPKALERIPLIDSDSWPKRYRRPWHIVQFNARQHQHVDPPWWCFYQAIFKQSLKAMLWEKNHQAGNDAIPDPENPYTYGWPATPGVLSACSRLGLGAWIWTCEMAWRLFTPQMVKGAGMALCALGLTLTLWSFELLDIQNGRPAGNLAEQSGFLVVALAVLLSGGTALTALVSSVTSSLFAGTPDSVKNYSLGSGDPLERFRRHFLANMKRFRRPILVVVDDLDRCEPGYVVELIRGMQTILMSPRVVFLLLGDRDWIEKAFTQIHKDMQGIDVGPEHSFGGRFVEKAIQLSLVLPDSSEQERKAYVRKLLRLGDEPGGSVHEEFESRISEVVQIGNSIGRDRGAAELSTKIAGSSQSPEVKAIAIRELNRRVAMRVDGDEEATLVHRLEPIAAVLPANPRQIKRILNVISLVQEVARMRLNIQPGTGKWRQLVLWVILMSEWPQTWFTLSKHPGVIDLVHDEEAEGATDEERAWARSIKAHHEAMRLLNHPNFAEAHELWQDTQIDRKTIEELKTLMPPASGTLLPVLQS